MSQASFIREHIARLGCTGDFVCVLTGIAPTKLSKAMRDLIQLTGPEATLLNKTLTSLDELIEIFEPVPVKLENPRIIKELLEDIENRKSTEAYSVKFGRNWFAGRIDGQVRSTFSMMQSTPMEHLIASKVAESLKPSWPDAQVVKNPFAGQDSIASEFDDVWN